MIWGIFLLLLGLSIVLNIFFNIHFPFVRALFAVFLIFIGFKMLLGSFWHSNCGCGKKAFLHDGQTNVVFSEKTIEGNSSSDRSKQYNVVFGKSTIDLSSLGSDPKDLHIEINTVFGNALVLLPTNMPVIIRSNAVFAEASVPNGDMVAFGQLNYSNSKTEDGTKASLTIDSNVVFGSLRFQTKGSDGKPSD